MHKPILFSMSMYLATAWTTFSFAQTQSPSPFDAGNIKIIDLGLSLDAKNPFWPGDNYFAFDLKTISTLENDGVLSKTFSMPEHLGTHIDAPNHFEKGQPSVDEIPAEQLFGPGVVIDISMKAEVDADAWLTINDIRDWETDHGEIPQRAIVLLHTGWGRFVKMPSRYQNRDTLGKMHFPAFSPEAATWLIKQRNIRGLGLDTMSIDRGISTKFEVHHIVNGAGRYGLENVMHLDMLPPCGFSLIVAPIKIAEGTGGPTRIWAVVPNE
ncbi:MAG: cyclase family protein [Planctomycetota bacterium]|nr:cyclase family protein [Planctomycetota bacterium]MDA1212542.1 cyclase family protein [Planctomycetota bacterium]